MSRIHLNFAVILLVLLASCETYVSTKTIERELLTFKHAGKTITIPVELEEIRTSRRRGRLFSGRRVTYSYAIVMRFDGQQLIEEPSEQNASLHDFISKLKIRRSKDRTHFAIGRDHKTYAIFHSFNKHPFVGYAPFINPDEAPDFTELKLNSLTPPRTLLLDHMTGDSPLPGLSENTLTDILCSLPPQDELNREAIYMLTDNKVEGLSRANEDRLISHCRKSDAWRRTALAQLKESREDLDVSSYVFKMNKLAGRSEVDKEDWKALKAFTKSKDPSYFAARMEMNDPRLSESVKNQFKAEMEKMIFNVCALSENQQSQVVSSILLLQEMGEKKVFERFVEKYEQSGCKSQTIHTFNNAFMFISNLKQHEKRTWTDFMIRNFKYVPANDRGWDYDRIKEELTCNQKRELLLKYRKDIDRFGDMEVPECR